MSTTMMAKLRAAILTGTVALVPTVALADDAPNPSSSTEVRDRIPDHAQAEARGGDADASAVSAPGIPDHQEAQARGADDAFVGDRTTTPVPDHSQAEDPHADK